MKQLDFGKCACGGCNGECEEGLQDMQVSEPIVPPTAPYVHGFVAQSIATVLTDLRTGGINSPVNQKLDIGTLSRALSLLEGLMQEELK